jgi:predicted nucleic acid-binding protein
LVVLDSWALLAYLKGEPAAEKVQDAWLSQGAAVSSVNLGEVLYIRIRERGEKAANADVERIRKRSEVLTPDWALVRSAASIKADGGLSYADAFCVATARHLDSPLLTGDPEIAERADELGCAVVDLRGA